MNTEYIQGIAQMNPSQQINLRLSQLAQNNLMVLQNQVHQLNNQQDENIPTRSS